VWWMECRSAVGLLVVERLDSVTAKLGEGNETLGENRPLVRDPSNGPVSLTFGTWDYLAGVEEVFTMSGVLDVRVDEGVCPGVDVLHRDLKAMEVVRFTMAWISFEKHSTRFSLTIPSEVAKNTRTCETKWRSLLLSLLPVVQSWRSFNIGIYIPKSDNIGIRVGVLVHGCGQSRTLNDLGICGIK
jgi:hypothetical protein